MKTIKFIVYLNLLFVFSSCGEQIKQSKDERTKITKIVMSSISGSRLGGSSNLSITVDSIFFEHSSQVDSQRKKVVKIKTPKNLWEKLNDSLNVDSFKSIKSNPGHVQYDGTDVTGSLYANEKMHSVINPGDDKINFEKIKQFYALLEEVGFRLADVYGLTGKSFSAIIESVCVETSPPNPCASYQTYLGLKFSEFEVEVSEKEIASCGKVKYNSKYVTQWHFKNPDQVVINKLTSRNKQIIEGNSLNFNENKLIGIPLNKVPGKYTFSEQK